MSSLEKFPIVTVIMILVTFIFVLLYMVTSNLFFYGDNSLKSSFEAMGNQTMPENNSFRSDFFNNSEQQKTFFQYGMIGSVCVTPVCALIEILSGRKRTGE